MGIRKVNLLGAGLSAVPTVYHAGGGNFVSPFFMMLPGAGTLNVEIVSPEIPRAPCS